MRRRILVAAVALAATLGLSAYDREDFDRVVAFPATMKVLSGLSEAEARAAGLLAKVLLLDGTVASMQFLDPEEESFEVELELVSGEWIGLEEVKIYRCLVRFRGREFFRVFPRRAPKLPSADQVVANDRILVVAKAVGRNTPETGEPLWVLSGLQLRPLR